MPTTGNGGSKAEPHPSEVMLASCSLLYLIFLWGRMGGSGEVRQRNFIYGDRNKEQGSKVADVFLCE